MTDQILVPFLKWAGGKRWLASSTTQFAPENFNTYIEPFLGSAAVFFSLNLRQGILSDLNGELINTYQAIRDDYKKIIALLRAHDRKHSHDYYYKVRSAKPRTSHTRAARFLYLNRTCWNGLYRVNLKGEFNVPKGTKDRVLLETDDFEKIAWRLAKAHIVCQDFEKTIDMAEQGDFVFIDPPYTVKHNLNGFIKYNETIFSWNDQLRLRDAVARALKRGAQITMSNADHESIRLIYADLCDIETVERTSVIAGNSVHRKKTSEALMRMGWQK